MIRKPDGMGRLTTGDPYYCPVTKVFRQSMEFRSDKVEIDGEAIKHIVKRAEELFVGVLKMNELDDFKWPPDEVEVIPHSDLKGCAILFRTRAVKKRPLVLAS